MKSVVELEGATRSFGEVVAVEDVTLDLRAGEILGLYGPSGSGKTTTIRLALGVHRPTAGKVRIFGVPSHKLGTKERQQIGYAPQRFIFPPTLSAWEAVWFAAGLYGIPWWTAHGRIKRTLERVDLWQKRNRRLSNLSGGEQRRVANAAALVHSPGLVFLDEPTNGLDPILRNRMWEWFKELRDEGRTMLISGHYLNDVEHCDRVALIVNSRLAAVGTPIELRRQALGGDIVEVIVDPAAMARAVSAVPRELLSRDERGRVRAPQWKDYDRFWITVAEAGPSVPAIVNALQEQNIQVESVGEVRPPFDAVFEQLVNQQGHRRYD